MQKAKPGHKLNRLIGTPCSLEFKLPTQAKGRKVCYWCKN